MNRSRRSTASASNPATPSKDQLKEADTPKKETPAKKPPATKAEKKENGSVEESPAAAVATPSATPNAAGDGPAKEEKPSTETPKAKEGSKEGEDAKPKKERKPLKKTIPVWATLSKSQQDALAKKKAGSAANGLLAVPARQVVVDAVEHCADAKGRASVISMRKYALKRCPNWQKMVFKNALKKAVDTKAVVQVKGMSIMTGTYKVGPKAKEADSAKAKKVAKTKKMSKSRVVVGTPDQPLDNLLPNIFTWVCEPKEASFGLIRKYIAEHHKHLDTEGKAFLKAVENGVSKGQLERLTGKGGSGTFQLVDGAKKSGSKYEDAIEDAIIAMNEPKDASVASLKHYLSEYHLEYRVADRPLTLRKALERCEERGWIKRITGKGMSGTFRLAFPYFPNPRELWGEWYEEEDEPKPKKKRRVAESSDEEEEDSESEEEEESDSEDDEPVYIPKKKRGAPMVRKPLPPKKKKAPAKKSPAKRRR